jgi:uncharacterized protein (DUF1330 family)
MPVYLITDITVFDEEAYRAYTSKGRSTVAQFGGKLLAPGVRPEVIEGQWAPSRMSIVEFPTREAALEFYHSPDYQDARKLRRSVADFNMVLVPAPVQI